MVEDQARTVNSKEAEREGMRKKIAVGLIVTVACLFAAGGIYAKVADTLKVSTKGYDKLTKGELPFSHKKHSEDYAKQYADLYAKGCGECHHDAKNQPLKDLKADSKVQTCIECHKKPGEAPKGKDAPKLTKEQKREYHAEALHDNCQGCHKDFNKKYAPKKAPVTCNDCHPKK
jgi:cytochrome c553